MATTKKRADAPIISSQVYQGLKAYGYYEAWYWLIISTAVLILIGYVLVSVFGENHYTVFVAPVTHVEPHPDGKSTITVRIVSPDSQALFVDFHTTRKNIHEGDHLRLYIDPTDYTSVNEHKPVRFNLFGILTIAFLSIVWFFIVVRFALILSIPGLAAATPVLQALTR